MLLESKQNGTAACEEHASSAANPPPSLSSEAVEEIRAQLERMLASAPFRTSKRYPRFLRFVVNETLSGRTECVKERVLAVHVFDRPPEYDSNIDPIVRVAAGDIRKRIAQYYIQPGHESELRIELLPGSYVPTFAWPESKFESVPGESPLIQPQATPEASPLPQQLLPPHTSKGVHPSRSLILCFAVSILVLAAVAAYVWMQPSQSLEAFWKPFLSASNPPLICLADVLSEDSTPEVTAAEDPNLYTWLLRANHVPFGDVAALVNVSGELQRSRTPFRVAMSNSVNFTNLRAQPVVLIGGIDNPWTARFLSGLRYTMARGADPESFIIRDTQSSKASLWGIKFLSPVSSITHDYGIVTRFANRDIEQPTMIVAGMGPYATTAAGEFITNPQYFREFTHAAPHGWAQKNVEIVIETEVVNGQSGPPHMVAFNIW